MRSDLDAELNPYYCTHCRCRISRKESDVNNGLCEACAAQARSRAQEAEQELAAAIASGASAAASAATAAASREEDAPFDAWLITSGCGLCGTFWMLCVFAPYVSWFAGVVYLTLGWLSIPHCQTEAGRLAARRIIESGAAMCMFAALAGLGIILVLGSVINNIVG